MLLALSLIGHMGQSKSDWSKVPLWKHQFEKQFKFKKNEVSLVELKYSLFMCELMVDENLIMAFLEKRKPGHYVVENGFIFIAEDNLR